MYLLERKEATYENLRDLNFEYKAGKLSEQDYAVQRASLEDEAAAILAEMESIEKARAVVRHGTRRAGVQAPTEAAREQLAFPSALVRITASAAVPISQQPSPHELELPARDDKSATRSTEYHADARTSTSDAEGPALYVHVLP